jgi:hypothetical protein
MATAAIEAQSKGDMREVMQRVRARASDARSR